MKKLLSKIVSVGLIFCMTGAMAGCSKSEETTKATTAADTTAADTTAGDSSAADTTAAAEKFTVQEGKLIMATNAFFQPYEYYQGDKIVGIDAEIAEALAKKLGLELQIMDVEFDSIIAGVQNNKYDFGMAGMTVTDTRKKAVNFTTTYATGIQAIIVKEGSEIVDIDTLLGGNYKVGVQQGTTGDIYMSAEPDDGGVGESRIVRYSKGPDAVLALSTGKVDAVVIDNEPAKSFVAANEGLKILETPFTVEDYAMCVNKDNTVLLDKLNAALKELTDDGTIASIIEKYIPSNG
ncbi:MAG: transporter substrate-binding domain-containing protein [Clostridiales bacterium]|nr:transporter substrate-binding domain-containing protein [Clostridiales bacterium]